MTCGSSSHHTVTASAGMKWAMRKKGLPEILVKAVMSLYEGAETKVRVGSGLPEESFFESWCTPMICVVAFVVCNGLK